VFPESGPLKDAVEAEFVTFNACYAQLSARAAQVQGSGWAWLAFNRNTERLELATTQNQDLLQATTGLVPLLAIDVWEHAYHRQYGPSRPDFLKALRNVINFRDVEARLIECTRIKPAKK
jgi:superoxide dismutase, Fe-Mn family